MFTGLEKFNFCNLFISSHITLNASICTTSEKAWTIEEMDLYRASGLGSQKDDLTELLGILIRNGLLLTRQLLPQLSFIPKRAKELFLKTLSALMELSIYSMKIKRLILFGGGGCGLVRGSSWLLILGFSIFADGVRVGIQKREIAS